MPVTMVSTDAVPASTCLHDAQKQRTEIPGLEFFLERHFGGLSTKLTSSQENGVYSGGWFVMRAMAL